MGDVKAIEALSPAEFAEFRRWPNNPLQRTRRKRRAAERAR
jgi:hypothetical protein